MITKVKIKNFQSHQDTTLEFHPGVNVVVGSSDSGKSAVFRAITWVMTNRPLGHSFLSWGTQKTEVELTIDGVTVGREKSKTENWYRFDSKELLAGTEVPQDIQSLLKVDPVINIQQQIAAPFLLSSTPGDVASFFNDIAGLSDIDLSVKNLKSWTGECGRQIKRLEMDVLKHQGKVEEFTYLFSAEAEITKIEKCQERIAINIPKIAQLKNLIHKKTRCEEALESYENKARAVQALKPLDIKFKQLQEQASRKVTLLKLVELIVCIDQAYQIKARQGKPVTAIAQLSEKILCLKELVVQQDKIQVSIKIFRQTRTAFQSKLQLSQQTTQKLKTMMPSVCPLCNQEIR